jgi:hypothetical protein
LNYTAVKAKGQNVLVPLIGPRPDLIQLKASEEMVNARECSRRCIHKNKRNRETTNEDQRTDPFDFKDYANFLSYWLMNL